MSSTFTQNHIIYWPAEFSNVVDSLKGLNSTGEQIAPATYRFNWGPIMLAASVGLRAKRQRDVTGKKQEISVSTFEGQSLFGQTRLSTLIQMIGLIHTNDPEIVRPEREEECCRIFERYVAGGLEILNSKLLGMDDPSGENTLRRLSIDYGEIDSGEVIDRLKSFLAS